ncbi:hypothetical protein Y1Q_0007240 [Alligator mississippiensis]|uniref:Uncharacterized protein n=1 Tax=Alligator mississippiensis TaxID=8496 RepID=A0A151NMQ4_ALLMI|nr:hypothetical protein Y1Q_0007240 [Alligator mississippiensis]
MYILLLSETRPIVQGQDTTCQTQHQRYAVSWVIFRSEDMYSTTLTLLELMLGPKPVKKARGLGQQPRRKPSHLWPTTILKLQFHNTLISKHGQQPEGGDQSACG